MARKLRAFDAICKDVYKTGASGNLIRNLNHLSRRVCIVSVRVYENGSYFVRHLDQGNGASNDREGIHGEEYEEG